MSYEHLDNPALGGRVQFRHAHLDDDPSRYVRPSKLAEQGIPWAYLNADDLEEYEALNSLGLQLGTEHPPYDPHPPAGMLGWYRFMDDLETMAQNEAGMVIIVDNAAKRFADPGAWVFELITVWVLQLRGWQLRNRPCQLIFQMDTDPAVATIYGQAR